MRVDQLEEREDHAAVLAATLEALLFEARGHEYRVSPAQRGGQRWHGQTWLSAYFVPDAGSLVRTFLADGFRHTPVAWRAPAQWTLGSALASRPGLRWASRFAFEVTPAVDRARDALIVPGNQRVRWFELDRGTVRARAKAGFDRAGLRNEIALRRTEGPWPGLTAFDPAGEWLEEAVIDGYALPRCPPWWSRARLLRRALEQVEAWSASSVRMELAEERAHQLSGEIAQCAERTEPRFGAWLTVELRAALAALTRAAGELRDVPTALTHGDFQAGNVMVTRARQPVVIDWEHAGRRLAGYDRWVLALGSRSPRGLAERVAGVVSGSAMPEALAGAPASRRWRAAFAAAFSLEDLAFYAREAGTGPYRALPGGLTSWLDECPRIAHDLAQELGR